MSTAAVATSPTQLSFPWMPADVDQKSTKRSTSKAAKKTSGSNSSASHPANFASPTQSTQTPSVRLKVVSTTTVEPVESVSRSSRVGEVKIGAVMLKLLKKYGITDEEIASVIATIEMEKCGVLAG